MLKNKIIPFLFSLLLAGNRTVSQSFNLGGLYYYEFLLALALAAKPKKITKELVKNYPAVILIAYTLTILAIEFFLYGPSSLALRRAALGLYIITPVIITAFHDEIRKSLSLHYNFFVFIILVFSIFQVGGFQATMAAQLVGALALFEFIKNKVSWRACILVAIYLVLVSGVLTGQSTYRTPVLTTLTAAAVAYFFSASSQKIKRKFIVYSCAAFFLTLPIFFSGVLNKTIGGILMGLSGIFDSYSLMDAGVSLGGDTSSSRGDASGNTKTRTMFWISIFEYQLNNIRSFIFGYGLQHGFMEVTLPDMPFTDKPLIDPHNSFVNLFFRFGLVGLALYIWSVFRVYKNYALNNRKSLPFLIVSIMFASFEVALENPHGNMIFWFIIFLPSLLTKSAVKAPEKAIIPFVMEKQIENIKHP